MNKKVVIVGRTNVGKSTLFNRLSSSVKSMVLDFSGVTRDFIKDTISWDNSTFDIVDSGGLILHKAKDEIEKKVRDIALELIKDADLILFVCDGVAGVLQEDREIAKILHQNQKPVMLVINKIDTRLAQEQEYEFTMLGFKNSITVSAQHGINVGDLLDSVVKLIGTSTPSKEDEPVYRVVLLGKPNVGKSSLLNLLLDHERSIVANQPGTTREAISEKVRFYKETIQLTDTAGVRRQRAVNEKIETLMVKSTFGAVKEADIILLLIDSSMAEISDQELKLAFYVFEEGKALIFLFNKEDLSDERKKKDLEFSLSPYGHLMKKIEKLNISCKSGKNVGKILPLINEVWQRYSHKFTDTELTDLFKNALAKTPLYHSGFPLMLFSVKQLKTAPITISLTVNQPSWFGESQKSFFENILRAEYDLRGVPVLFSLRKRGG